jgi:hypothetical protein
MPPRPLYGADVIEAILLRLRAGETLRAICRDEGMPDHSTVLEWVRDDRDGFANRYAQAREAGVYAMADELLEIADDGTNDWTERQRKDGSTKNALNKEHVQRSRLRADTRKWLLSKILPRVFGDKLDVTTQGEKVTQPFVMTAPAEIAEAVDWAKQHKPR